MSLRRVLSPSRCRRRISFAALPVAAAVALTCSDGELAFAQGLFDIFGGGSGGDVFGSPQSQSPGGPAQSDEDASPRRHRRSKHRDRSKDEAAGDEEGYTSICVRTCDGYTFPIGTYRGSGDRPAHEATCRAQCPGATTALYLRPGGSDTLENAVRADTRQSYSKLPTAFKFKSDFSQACTCHLAGSRRLSFARDYTLRRGDVVMTKDGLKVFHGGTFPFKPTAFSPLLLSRDVARKDLVVFEAIDRARLQATESRELTVTRGRKRAEGPAGQ